MEELALKVEHVSKEYRLGQIGGGTLKAEIQSKIAKWRHKEDPNLKIGEKAHEKNERFLALDDVSFEIKKGEKIGIIGHNGAGKSTILKLICRVTAPTKGNIYLNGRITSMLEVGTGFHGELTGRENIYLNGSILGMSKAEIDEKIDEIIEFSEVKQFIDTPVKRYSSGMHVKLGFAVASHLNSEIMIMDEVLAVGDMAFQNKCIEQMKKVADEEGRTILYVSHNMNTIRQLCDRCIVLEHGTVAFIGDVEEAIEIYLGGSSEGITSVNYNERPKWIFDDSRNIANVLARFDDKESNVISASERMIIHFSWENISDINNLCLRIEIRKPDRTIIGTAILNDIYSGKKGDKADFCVSMGVENLVAANYASTYTFFFKDKNGANMDVFCAKGLDFKVDSSNKGLDWNVLHWGNVIFSEVSIE